MPDILSCLRSAYSENPAAALDMLPELFQAADEGKIVELTEKLVLAMSAGARAIEQSRQYKFGATYVYDVFGNSKEISYYEAASVLREAARKEAGMSQTQLARKAGVSTQMICAYERDRREPNAFVLCCLADALEVTMDYLYGRDEKSDT